MNERDIEIYAVFYAFLAFLFIVLKLTQVVNVAWIAVLAPVYGPIVAMGLILSMIGLLSLLRIFE